MWGRIGLVALSIALGLAAGVSALLGVASVSDWPALFFLAGLAAFALIVAGGGILATRGMPARLRGDAWRAIVGSASVVVLIATLAALAPLGDPASPATPVPGQRFWELSTGSRIAYVKIAAEGKPKATPIIFIHGGPGVPMMADDARYFGQLARDGYDVYLYDQIGAGLSPRLADPTQYTIARHVADLEAIRQQIGAQRVILIGHSWGGSLAATYLAEYPEHVEKIVFSSPGAIFWPEMGASGTGMIGRLTNEQKWQALAEILPPRALLAYALVQVNPRAAHAYVGDGEMDARFDQLFARVAPGLFCDVHAPPSGEKITGLGFYANQVPQAASAPRPMDPRPALRALRTPALTLKGSCDYVPWGLTLEYRDILPQATLVYLPGAGHQAYQDQPGPYLATVRAFLLDEPLPIQPYTSREPPSDYTGAR
jgi:proline iminopeptidase